MNSASAVRIAAPGCWLIAPRHMPAMSGPGIPRPTMPCMEYAKIHLDASLPTPVFRHLANVLIERITAGQAGLNRWKQLS